MFRKHLTFKFDVLNGPMANHFPKNQPSMTMDHLLTEYRNRIYGMVLKYVKIPAVAEDLTQDILLGIWKNKSKVETSGNIEAYILTIAKNGIRDHFKKMAREKDYLELVVEHMRPKSDNPYTAIQRLELQQKIQSIVRELPEKQQRVYRMVFEQGKSLGELSKELKISAFTAKNHKAQALKTIRAKIKPEAFLTYLLLLASTLFH